MKTLIGWLPFLVIALSAYGQHTDIVWDRSTLVQVCKEESGYARMVVLSGDSLLCMYESRGAIECSVSADLGKTWLSPATVAPPEPGIRMAAPDVIRLKDRSLLAAYNPRPYGGDTTKRFGIRTRKSYDGGRTWTDERTLYEASYRFDDGCWEPAPVQLPSGDIDSFPLKTTITANLSRPSFDWAAAASTMSFPAYPTRCMRERPSLSYHTPGQWSCPTSRRWSTVWMIKGRLIRR